MGKPTITQARLKELLHYDPDSGVFVWKKSRPGVAAGSMAGSVNGHGYICIHIDGNIYGAHRLAFLYMSGYFPDSDTDHINGIRNDNHWNNLRAVSHIENQRNKKRHKNNTSGITGVYWDKIINKWRSQIKVNNKSIYLGCFWHIEDAVKSRADADIKYGFHKNHGREK